MSLDGNFKVSKSCAITNVSSSLSLCLVFVDQDVNSQPLVQHHVCPHAATLPSMTAIDSPSEIIISNELFLLLKRKCVPTEVGNCTKLFLH